MPEEAAYQCMLSAEVQRIAIKELNENPLKIDQEVEALRIWIKSQPNLNARTDTQTLLRYLRGCKYSQERAREKVEMYYNCKSAVPKLLQNRDPLRPELDAIFDMNLMVPLPGYDSQGRKVIFGRLGAWDPEKVVPENLFKAASMLFDVLFLEDEQVSITGFVQVHDMKGITWRHAAALNLSLIRKVMTVWTEGYTTRPKAVHYMNGSSAFDALFKIFSKFMKDKMKDRIFVHGKNLDNMFNSVPKEMLPNECGGSGGEMQTITDYWKSRIHHYRQWFLEDENYKASIKGRSKRFKAKLEPIMNEPSFRRLEID